MTKRVLITCSRSWTDWPLSTKVLRRVYARAPRAILVSGHNPRGDQNLERIWRAMGGWAEEYEADWSGPCRPGCKPGHRQSRRGGNGTYCPAAGDYRNHKMASLPAVVLCLAFIGPCIKDRCYSGLPEPHASHGALDCADYAEFNLGIPTLRWERFGAVARLPGCGHPVHPLCR